MSLRWILIGALVLRCALPAAALAQRRDTAVFLFNDSPNYLLLASTIANEGTYRGNRGPELYRPPGYPLFLALTLHAPQPLIAIVLLQALLGVLSVYLVFLTAALLLPPRAALFAALLTAVDPLLIFWTTKVMSETLFAAWLMLFLYLLVRYLLDPETRFLTASACALAGAAYVRAIAFLLPLWIVVILIVWAWHRGELGRRGRDVAVFFLICAGLLGAWSIRNGRQTGYYGFSTIADRALYFGAGAAVTAEQRGQSFYDTRNRFVSDYNERYQSGVDEDVRGYQEARHQGLAMIASAPMTVLRVWVAGQIRTVFDPGAVEYLRLFGRYPAFGGLLGRIIDRGILTTLVELPVAQPSLFLATILFAVWSLPSLILALWAPVTANARARPAVWVLLGVIVFLLSLSGGAYGSSRFRHPMQPILAVLAGFVLVGRDRVGRPASTERPFVDSGDSSA